jgi:hypothetical protein
MRWLGALLAIGIVGYTAFKLSFPTYSYRYRLQISLSVDEKVYTGSSVIEVTWECGPKVVGLGQCSASLGGQAAAIDLGPRGVVVATLRTGYSIVPVPDGAVDAVWLCARAFGSQSANEELPALPNLTGRRNLSASNYPRLVWFSKPNDQSAAVQITPETVAAKLDPTARFVEAFVEITRAPITTDIATKLPWLPALVREQKGRMISGRPDQFMLIYNMFVGENS